MDKNKLINQLIKDRREAAYAQSALITYAAAGVGLSSSICMEGIRGKIYLYSCFFQ